jgi:hypothetical protein
MNGTVAPLKTKKRNKIEIITIRLAGKTLLFGLLRLLFDELFDMT